MQAFKGKTMNDLVDYTLDLQDDYQECALRQQALAKWAEKQ
jgi:hypothetical protein